MAFYHIFLQKVKSSFEEKACYMGLQCYPHPIPRLNYMFYNIKLLQQTRKCHSPVWMLLGYGLSGSKTSFWDKVRTPSRWGEVKVIGPGGSPVLVLWMVTFVSTKRLFKIKQKYFFQIYWKTFSNPSIKLKKYVPIKEVQNISFLIKLLF